MRNVKSIYIYPVKSLGGVSLRESQTTETGLLYDRRAMLVDSSGRFITQRENLLLARIGSKISGNSVKFYRKDAPDDEISFSMKNFSSKRIQVSIWKHSIEANIMNPQINNWFSNAIEQNCQLAIMDRKSNRIKSLKIKPYKSKLSFADGYPYLITTTASLKDLNDKLQLPIPMNRFRPNLVIQTKLAFEEDNWNAFQLGSASFVVAKKCGRCVLTTTDQDTGERFKEPLKTLSTFRKKGKTINFGFYAICVNEGVIHVGDEMKM